MDKIISDVKMTGEVEFTLLDKHGNIKEHFVKSNLVVTAGKNHLASRLIGTSSGVMSHMGVGTDSTTPAAEQTALIAQSARVALESAVATANVVTYEAKFLPGIATGTLREAGLFNASSGGTMLCRTTYSSVVKGVDDSLIITWNVTIN